METGPESADKIEASWLGFPINDIIFSWLFGFPTYVNRHCDDNEEVSLPNQESWSKPQQKPPSEAHVETTKQRDRHATLPPDSVNEKR